MRKIECKMNILTNRILIKKKQKTKKVPIYSSCNQGYNHIYFESMALKE